MSLKGLHDIKTHGSLSHEGRLVSVARNLHKLSRGSGTGDTAGSGDWSIEQHMFRKGKSGKTISPGGAPIRQDPGLAKKVKLSQIAFFEDALREMHSAAAAGMRILDGELERLETRLALLKVG